MTARERAISLLKEYGCDLDCYRNDISGAIRDLQYLEANGRTFEVPTRELAEALVEIGNDQPVQLETHKPFLVIYDTDSWTDGREAYTLEEALADVEEIYFSWMHDETHDWAFDEEGMPQPTKEQVENWNYMICNCSAYVVQWDPEKGEYADSDEAIYLPDEKLEEIGWKEIPEDNTDDTPILIPPGETLGEVLEDRGISTTDFAEAAGLSDDAVEAILEGSKAITEEIAEKFEKTIGVPASFWSSLQANYDRECEEAGVERN